MSRNPFRISFSWLLALVLSSSILLAACSLPQVQAEDRLFLDLSLEFLDEYRLSDRQFQGTPLGGLSGITYDRERDRFYAISDDRSDRAPARFYTLHLTLDTENPDRSGIDTVAIEAVTFLQDADGQPYPPGSIDPEGIALSPNQRVFISSEGVARDAIDPTIGEYDLQTGQLQQYLPLPPYYRPDAAGNEQQEGVQDNLGFEALTLNFGGSVNNGEPFRVFAATESALLQDRRDSANAEEAEPPRAKSRLLHYLVTSGRPQILAEHLYCLEATPPLTLGNGLTDLVSIDGSGHFLSLERTYGVGGFGAKIFQLAMGDATDIAGYNTLTGDLSGVRPIRKRLVLDLKELEISLDNLEGIALGPHFRDGSPSLLLVSDDNFNEDQVTQFLLFRLSRHR